MNKKTVKLSRAEKNSICEFMDWNPFFWDDYFEIDWNATMMIVDKIDSLGYTVDICNNQCRIFDKELNGFIRKKLFPSNAPTNLEATIKTILQFIESKKK